MNDIEKIVESVLPLCPKGGIDRIHLAQALTEKKLVVPLSEEEILKHFERYQEQHDEMNENSRLRAKCAKDLYEAQFNDKQ